MTIRERIYEFGYKYAETMQGQDGFCGPVDINTMVGGTVDIPEGDYIAMRNAKIFNPDPRLYWKGFSPKELPLSFPFQWA